MRGRGCEAWNQRTPVFKGGMLEAVSVTRQFPDEATFLDPRISGQNPSVDFRFWHIADMARWLL